MGEVVNDHGGLDHEHTNNPQATGPEPQIVTVQTQEVAGSTNWLEVGCYSSNQFPGTAEHGRGRGLGTSLMAGSYVAEVDPSQPDFSSPTSATGHVGIGSTTPTETNLAHEATLWLEAGTRVTPNPVGVQHSAPLEAKGLEARGHEWTDPTHQAFWALLKDVGYEEL